MGIKRPFLRFRRALLGIVPTSMSAGIQMPVIPAQAGIQWTDGRLLDWQRSITDCPSVPRSERKVGLQLYRPTRLSSSARGRAPAYQFAVDVQISLGRGVQERLVTPLDLLATLYHLLGISLDTHFEDASDRPVSIAAAGRPIQELL